MYCYISRHSSVSVAKKTKDAKCVIYGTVKSPNLVFCMSKTATKKISTKFIYIFCFTYTLHTSQINIEGNHFSIS